MPTGHEKPFVSISLPTDQGMVHARHYVAVESKYAVLMVGTTSRRFDSPARKLYQTLAEALKQDGVTALQVALCRPEDLAHSIHDVRTGIKYLCNLGSKTVILIGFDRGAAAILAAVAHESCVSGVALLSLPADQEIPDIGPTSLLVIRAESDGAPKNKVDQLHAVKGHRSLDDDAEEVQRLLSDWIRRVRGDGSSQAA